MAQGIARASALLASGTMVSRVLGFVKAIVIAQTIGVVGSASADAFAGANQLPSNIYSIISVGLLNAVIVPQVVKAAKHADGGQLYINRLVTLAMVILGGLTVIATIGAPIIGTMYGAGLQPEQLGLVVAFAYWCMPQIFFYGMYAVLGEILNARGLFGPFAWAPVINNVVGIAGLMVFTAVFGADPTGERLISDWDPSMIAVLGGTASLGVAVQAIVLVFFWRKAGLRFGFDFTFRGTGLGQVGKLAGWTLGMLAVLQFSGLVETNVANLAFGDAAGVAAMQNAFLIFALPHAVIAVSIATAYFTRMSAAVSENRPKDYVRDLSEGTRLIGMFLVFAGFALALVSIPFARVFDSTDAGINSLALVIVAFVVGLVTFSGLFLVQRAFYALEDTRTPFWVFLFTMPVHIFGMAMAALLPVEYIVVGLALMQSVMSALRLAVLLFILRRRMGSVDLRRIFASYARFFIAATAAVIPAFVVMLLLGVFEPGSFPRSGILQAVISCAIGGIVMAVFYFPLLWVLKSTEFRGLAAPLLARFGIGSRPAEADAGTGPQEPAPEPVADDIVESFAGVPGAQEANAADLQTAELPHEREEREERANAAAWAMQGATADLSTAGILLPMHSRTTEIPKIGGVDRPRTRRERREREQRAVAELAARREAEAGRRHSDTESTNPNGPSAPKE